MSLHLNDGDIRPVWLTEDDFFDMLAGGQKMLAVRQKIIDAWDAAPSDTQSAISDTLEQLIADDEVFATACENVLRALGHPEDTA